MDEPPTPPRRHGPRPDVPTEFLRGLVLAVVLLAAMAALSLVPASLVAIFVVTDATLAAALSWAPLGLGLLVFAVACLLRPIALRWCRPGVANGLLRGALLLLVTGLVWSLLS